MTEPMQTMAPCDVCGTNPALISIMLLTDWTQRKCCPLCAPAFLRSTADDIEQTFTQAAGETGDGQQQVQEQNYLVQLCDTCHHPMPGHVRDGDNEVGCTENGCGCRLALATMEPVPPQPRKRAPRKRAAE